MGAHYVLVVFGGASGYEGDDLNKLVGVFVISSSFFFCLYSKLGMDGARCCRGRLQHNGVWAAS